MRNQGTWDASKRTKEAFEEAIKVGKESDWYDDALYHYAEWLRGQGEFIILKGGQKVRKQNFVKALQYYRRIVNEFKKGETRYFNDARRNIDQIIKPILRANVSNFFLPGSEVQFHLNWRNLKEISLTLHSIDLTGSWKPNEDPRNANFFNNIRLDGDRKITAWKVKTEDKGEHRPGNRTIKVSEKLKTGAYLITARSRGLESRQLILVTDAALVVKTSHKQNLLYFADSFDGSPIANARVAFF